VAELDRLGLRPREVALDGGFVPGPTTQVLAGLAPTRTFISGRAEPGSRRTRKRLARYRTGCEGRISHLKRGYGLRRSRLKGDQGQRIWTGWAVLAYNLDTLAPSTPPERDATRHTQAPCQAHSSRAAHTRPFLRGK
jgi:transposase, IS5 family